MFPTDWTNPLAYVGLAALSYTTFKFTRQATVYLLPSALTKTHNPNGKNWALVTGATDGIGFGFCQELCARGFNVILHGRNAEKLQRRVRELEAEFPNCKTGVVALDVVGVTAAAIDEVASQVRMITEQNGGDLTVLVNNVGGELKPNTILEDYTFEEASMTVDMNVMFMLQITRVFVYAASKGFVNTFTRALEAEAHAEGQNLDVLVLLVGQVRTASFGVKRSLFVPDGRGLASAALNRVGCGQVMVWAYFWHWLQGISFDVLPRSLLMKITADKIKALGREMEWKSKNT
ncbi:hypothetical protein N7454_007380 [Penicillium verhagenii]|nr:hypothetical protein N7454_007380 [Penicillium verhagenii]